MRFETPRCPVCDGSAGALLESMLVHQEIEAGPDGEFEYTGGYQDFFESIEPVEEAGQWTLVCAEDPLHEWLSQVHD
ncbi:MAG: hypothetical protein AB7Q30_12000 [Vicinamibacteria bacterium]